MLILSTVSLTAHLPVKLGHLSTSLTSQMVVMSSYFPTTFDNSNPAVQAEQLNWLHFMMNFGSIVANDPTANLTESVSMRWTMLMQTCSKLPLTTSSLATRLEKVKKRLLSTCLSWKLGLTTTLTTTRIPRVLNCRLTTSFVFLALFVHA